MSAVERRLHGLDLARYLALAGMVLVNFRLAMAVPAEGQGWLAGFFHLLEGKASATFVTLAGLGLVLATQRLGWMPLPARRPGGARCSCWCWACST